MAGVSLSHWPVSHTSARSAVTSLPCLARKPGSDGEPHSSSPSISTLMASGSAPGDALPGPHRLDEGHQLALVVLGAARHDHLAVGLVGGEARLERRRLPQLQRIGRLHVVVAVEQHVRRAVARAPLRAGRPPWDGPWSAPPGLEADRPAAVARTIPPPCGSAPCRPDRSRRSGCGSARTAARAPRLCVASSVFRTLGAAAFICRHALGVAFGGRAAQDSGQPGAPVNQPHAGPASGRVGTQHDGL